MDVRVEFLFLLMLCAGWACAARHMADTEISDRTLVISEIPATQMREQEQENQASDGVIKNKQVCTLCKEFTEQALDYLAENKTQTEIIEMLQVACSQVLFFKQQCLTFVDYYIRLLFLEISSVQPEEFCRKANLCKEIVFVSSKLQEDRCGLCHRAVSEVLLKLKNPDTQLEIIELLLKACDSMENYAGKCKKLVFEYGPIILANAEQFLETTDICTMLHTCDSAKSGSGEVATMLNADS